MADLPREVLLEAGLVLGRDEADESNPRRYAKSQVWYPRMYAERAHIQDFIRHQVYLRDKTICVQCHLNCNDLHQVLDWVKMALDRHHLGFDFHFSDFKRAIGIERCWRFPRALWDAHMLVPKSAGGSDTDIANFATLCLACHRRETNRQIYGRK